MNHFTLLLVVYVLGHIATFAFLVWEGIGDVHGVYDWGLWLVACELGAMWWPIYWGLIRWVY